MSAPVVPESERLRKQLQVTLKAERAANALIKLRNSPEVVKALQLRDEGKMNCAEISKACGKSSSSWWSTVAKKLGEPSLLKRTRTVPAKTPKKSSTALQDLMPDEMLWANYMAAAMTASAHEKTTLDTALRADEALEEHRQRFPRHTT